MSDNASDALDLHPSGWWQHLPAAAMLLAVLVFAVAEAALRLFPFYTQGFVLSLLPLLCLPACRRSLRLEGDPALWMLCLLAGAGYLALVQWLRPSPLMSWVGLHERATGICLAYVALLTRARAVDLLTVLGASAASSLVICAAVMWHRGDEGWFGMSNINYLVNTAGPPILAWCVLLGHRYWKRRPVPATHLILAGLGLATLLTMSVVLHRRGVQLAAIAALAMVVALRLGRHAPRLVWTLGLLATASVLAAVIVYVARYDLPPWPGYTRIPLWRSAWGIATEGLPWGLGSLGITMSHELDHPWSLFYGAGGAWDFHAHNEFLNALIDGGLPLFALLLAQVAIVVRHLRRIADRSLQIALSVLAAATCVHMLTSVCYGTPVGVVLWHLFVAAILKAEITPPVQRPRLPPARWLLLPLAAAVGIGGAWMSRKALMHYHASMAVRYASLLDIASPIGMVRILKPLAQEQIDRGGIDIGDREASSAEITRRLHRIYGDAGPFLQLRFMDVTKRYANLIGSGDPALPAVRQEFADTASQVARHFPFYRHFYYKLNQGLAVDPELEPLLDPHLVLRSRYHNAEDDLPPPDISVRPTDLEGLADLYAGVLWSIVHEVDWKPISDALRHLTERAGHAPNVAATTIQAAAHAGLRPHFEWTLDQAPRIGRIGYKTEIRNALTDIQTPWRARGVLPLIEALFPRVFKRLEGGRNAISADPRWIPVELEVLRIYRISRIEAEPPGPGAPADRSAPGSSPPALPADRPTPGPGSTPAPAP